MSTTNSVSSSAGKRVGQLVGLFVKDPELLEFCSRNQDRMIEVRARVKQYVPEVTVEDIQGALKEYAARRKPRSETDGKADPDLDNLRAGLQSGLLEVVRQIDRGYRITMWMYTAAFVVGLSMLVVSMIAAFRDLHSAALLGGLGALDVITFLVFKPAEDLQASRGGLAQLQAAFFAWINDIHNWNEYLDLLQNESGAGAPPFDTCKQISEIQGRSTEHMATLISTHTRFALETKKPRREIHTRRSGKSKADVSGAEG